MIALDVTPLVHGPWRGVARATRGLVEGFAAAPPGVPVRLLAPGPLPPDLPPLDGVLLAPRACASARRFRRLLPDLLREAGAEVLWSPWSAFPRVRIPVVVTVHELPFVRLGPVEGGWRTWRHRRWLARDVARAAAILVPSGATRADLLALHPEAASRVELVPNAFDPSPWREAAARPRPLAPPYVLMTGTGPPGWGPAKKGLDLFAAAIERLRDTGLQGVVVGRPEGALPSHVRVHADPDDVALRSMTAAARVLVHPARSEGFGYPALEAMACGVPVVATRAGALPEVVGDAALLVAPEDPVALAEAIGRAAFDEDLRERLRAAGAAQVERFAPAATARRAAAVLLRARAAA